MQEHRLPDKFDLLGGIVQTIECWVVLIDQGDPQWQETAIV